MSAATAKARRARTTKRHQAPARPPSTTPPPSDLLTAAEAALYLRAGSARTIERWRTIGDGPAFAKLGRRILYRRSDLDAWVDSRVRSHTGAA